MPSHLYWMPLTSVIAGLSMALFAAPGNYAIAQLPFALMCAATALVGFWLGWRLGGSRRHAWVAGLLTLLNPFYLKFWGEIDTVAPYALIGSLCLILIGLGAKRFTIATKSAALHPLSTQWRGGRGVRLWFAVGVLAALGHLTRADGMLLGIVAALVIVWVGARHALPLRRILITLAVLILGYVLVMLPYFARNLREIGTPLPLGGTQAIWFDQYDDIFNYPPDSSPQTLLSRRLDRADQLAPRRRDQQLLDLRRRRGHDRPRSAAVDWLVASAARSVPAAVWVVCPRSASGDDLRLSVPRFSRRTAPLGGGADPVLGGAGRRRLGRRGRVGGAPPSSLERPHRARRSFPVGWSLSPSA